jgi:hypothetical protein
MKLWKMKKSSDFDHEIMNLVEKNVGTPAILHGQYTAYRLGIKSQNTKLSALN